jgi:hypothetical protein
MCVILVCPPEVRPAAKILEACARANPHGAGVGWRQRGKVHWMKNLDPDEVGQLLDQIAGEAVIHFRWASVGGVDPRLCHPFPVDAMAGTKLSGTANRLLFHNGTWAGWKAALDHVLKQNERDSLPGPMSDSRAMALLVHSLRDPSVLHHVQGRVVLFGAKKTELFGPWQSWGGMSCSNLGFVYEIEREKRPPKRKAVLDAAADEQLALFAGKEAVL